jgi:uncharacterized membrane protein
LSEVVYDEFKAQQDLFMRVSSALLIIALILAPTILVAAERERQSLFKIERSKNANIIQYDAQIGANGKLYKNEPVIGYWVRLADQGQVKELNWIQRKFAFGFDAKYHQSIDSVTIKMVADIGQPIEVRHLNGKYRAIVKLDGKLSELDKIFIQSHGSGMSVTVDYVEVFGNDLKTGDKTYDKIIP